MRQNGISLIIALVMLLVLSLIVITAFQMAHLDQKMTNNLTDKALSFQTAESGLLQAETWLQQLTAEPVAKATCETDACVQLFNPDLDLTSASSVWWQQHASLYANGSFNATIQPPRYFIEFVRFVPDNPTIGNGVSPGIHYYRVTSRSVVSDQALSLLQTTLARRYK